jgi:hypothetical protein
MAAVAMLWAINLESLPADRERLTSKISASQWTGTQSAVNRMKMKMINALIRAAEPRQAG